MPRRRLTDAETWAILCAPVLDARTLADRFGISRGTVNSIRSRHREGWACRVAYVLCQGCGDLLTRGGRGGRLSRGLC